MEKQNGKTIEAHDLRITHEKTHRLQKIIGNWELNLPTKATAGGPGGKNGYRVHAK